MRVCIIKQLAAIMDTGERQQSKQKRSKIKIGIFTVIFLISYFCLHGILSSSKSYPEIESTWSTASASEESILTRDITQVFVQRFVYVFHKTYSDIESTWSISSSKEKLLCRVIVKNYLRNVLCKFLIKIESMWRREIEEQAPQPTLLCCGSTIRSNYRKCYIRKAVLKKFSTFTGKHCAAVSF